MHSVQLGTLEIGNTSKDVIDLILFISKKSLERFFSEKSKLYSSLSFMLAFKFISSVITVSQRKIDLYAEATFIQTIATFGRA